MNFKKKYILLLTLLPIQLLVEKIASFYPQIVENYFSNKFYPIISSNLRLLLGRIPFSVSEVATIILFLFILFSFFKLIKNKFKNFLPQLIKLFAIIIFFNFIGFLFWGVNSFREPLEVNLQLNKQQYSTSELITTTNKIIQKLNYYHSKIVINKSIKPTLYYSDKELFSKAINGFKYLKNNGYPQFKYKNPSIKSSSVNFLLTYISIEGHTDGITGEAMINTTNINIATPTIICHEMAHQIGWGKENEANFVGFLAAINNDDNYFKYAGYRMAFSYCIFEIYKKDKEQYLLLWNKVHVGINKDFKDSYNLSKKNNNFIKPWFNKIHDVVLKSNNQPNGIQSYNYVVDLLVAYYKDK